MMEMASSTTKDTAKTPLRLAQQQERQRGGSSGRRHRRQSYHRRFCSCSYSGIGKCCDSTSTSSLDRIFLLMVVIALLSSSVFFTVVYYPPFIQLQGPFFDTHHQHPHPILFLDENDDATLHNSSSSWQHFVSQSSFAACLLTMEDDFVLPEWIAYHYTKLPLRRLIVAVDPRSRTQPNHILDRWNDDFIRITVWNDTQFFPLSYRLSIMESQNRMEHNKSKTLAERHTSMHRFRQRFFYMKCLRQLKREYHQKYDRTIIETLATGDHREQTTSSSSSSSSSVSSPPSWVILIDSDEFLQSPNPNWKYYPWLIDQLHNQRTRHETTAETSVKTVNKMPSVHNNMEQSKSRSSDDWTALELLDRLQLDSRETTGPMSLSSVCIGLPRLLFGTKKNSHQPIDEEGGADQLNDLLATLNLSFPDLMTTQWTSHGELMDTKVNRAGKSMVNLKNVPYESFSFRNTDTHRPLMDFCTEQDVWIQNVDSPFVVRHYIGTFRQWSSRADARQSRNKERYDSFQQLGASRDTSVFGWVQAFVEAVGISKARYLLSGAGDVPKEFFDNKTTNPPLRLDEELERSQKAFNISFIRPFP